jgi:hypothetical protein
LNGLAGLVNGRVDFYVRGMSENGDWLVYEYEPEEPVLVENGKGDYSLKLPETIKDYATDKDYAIEDLSDVEIWAGLWDVVKPIEIQYFNVGDVTPEWLDTYGDEMYWETFKVADLTLGETYDVVFDIVHNYDAINEDDFVVRVVDRNGMFEDMAVMQYARYTDDPDMYRHAVARIVTYFAKYFDADGVQLENSPEYHMVIVEELKAFLEQADPKHTEGYAVLQEKYEKSHVFSNMVLLPDGTLPNIGDTKRMPIDLTEYYPEMPALSFGQELVRHSFYHAGYAIVKNENSYLLFRAGYILDDHHHNDDLSFWLYKNGDIVSEVGPFGYEYTNPYSEYVRSFAAHNSLLVDGENTINEAGEVVLLDSGHANTMQGKTTRIQGVEWTRAIRYNENFTEITLQDTVHSTDAKEHSYQLLFHLHPGISLQERADGEGYDLRRQDTVIGRFFTDATVSLTEDVYFDNYYVPGEKAQVIVLENNAQDWTANTRIELYP